MSDQVLPSDWKLDYDKAAQQWCYIHTITSRKQYTFPQDGDELNLGSEPAPLNPTREEPRHAEDQSLEVNMAALSVSDRENVGRRDSNAAAFRQPIPRSGTLQPAEDGAWRFVEPKVAGAVSHANGGGEHSQQQQQQESSGETRRSNTAVSALETPISAGLQVAERENTGSAHGQSQGHPTSMPIFATSQQGLVEMSGNWTGYPTTPLTTTPASMATAAPAPNTVSSPQQQHPPSQIQTPLSPTPSMSPPNLQSTPPRQQHQQNHGEGQGSSPTPAPSMYSVSSVGHDTHNPQRQDSMVSQLGYQKPPQGQGTLVQGYGGVLQQSQPQPQQRYEQPPQGYYAPVQQSASVTPSYQQPYPPQAPSVMSAPATASPYYPPQATPTSSVYSYGPSIHKSRFDALFPKNKAALPPPASRRPQVMRPPVQYQQPMMQPTEVQTMGNITINHYSIAAHGAAPAQQQPLPQQPQRQQQQQQQWYPQNAPPIAATSPPQYQQQPQQQYPVYQQPPPPQQQGAPMGPPVTVASPLTYIQPRPPVTTPSPYIQQTPASQQIYQPPVGFQQPQTPAPQLLQQQYGVMTPPPQ